MDPAASNTTGKVDMFPLSVLPAGTSTSAHVAHRRRAGFVALVSVLVAVLGLAACGKNQSAFDGTGSPRWSGSGPVPYGGGVYKVGNPYDIAGRTYYPREDTSYDQTGVASWYGEQFDRRQTANGEWFDMTRLTAAHPTLPLPVYARVTNASNNRSVVVRINDRGPFAHDRIIDLSRAAADELGFLRQGTTQVRVQYLSVASLDDDGTELVAMNERLRNGTLGAVRNASAETGERDAATGTNFASSAAAGNSATLTTGSVATASPAAATTDASGTRYYIQAASFSSRANALTLQDHLRHIGNVLVDQSTIGDRTYFRVRVGPLDDPDAAERALQHVRAAGQRDARIVPN
jgi:rare lipoprotein A